ncbi:MAG: vanadium-dependent haloperoxidase [Cyanobacteria bacterium P01_E01_bin.34]
MNSDRRQSARQVRIDAADLAFQREHPPHISNGEEILYRIDRTTPKGDVSSKPSHIANFTKGLPHNLETGVIESADDYQQFVRGIDSGDPQDFRDTPLGPPGQDGIAMPNWQSQLAQTEYVSVRAWESQGAGLTFDLQGPDAQAVTMPPAPTLDSPELAAEMLEVYSMALLRDAPVSLLREPCPDVPAPTQAPGAEQRVADAISRLNNSDWIANPGNLTPAETSRQRGPFDLQTVFRGVAPGDDVGPYISQFLLIGDSGLGNIPNRPARGLIPYGSITINQRIRVAEPQKDYMTTWEAWLDAQNGADLRGLETYVTGNDPLKRRFAATPRDLATYVHYDALYEAYLNACLILLSMGAPFDPGIPFQRPDHIDKQQGFAQFGGPHILSLVTEVATRALKAVRFQKFNVHRRLRPEAVGGWVTRYRNGSTDSIGAVANLVAALDRTVPEVSKTLLDDVASHNMVQSTLPDRVEDANNRFQFSYLLPMAFPEGSPMHPSYGAGHATVAGACVTILKAFFDHGYELRTSDGSIMAYEADTSGAPETWGDQLVDVSGCLERPLTVEGELNKLAANISIGRNWAGVHYFTDYIESLRMGEQIAIGILQEQKLTYGENFSMTVPLYDGGTVRI